MSLQTTLARAEANAAGDAWHGHRTHCPACVRAARSRKGDEMCAEGTRLYADRAETAAALKRERELDLAPAPEQAPLW